MSTFTEQLIELQPNDGDHERFAHIVVPREAVARAYVTGEEVTSICGKTWVPTRDPKNYPVCPTCQEIFEAAIGKALES